MYSTTDKVPKFMKIAVVMTFTAALAVAPLALAAELEKTDGSTKEVKGKAGTASANPVIAAHAAENIGDADCKQIFVEKK